MDYVIKKLTSFNKAIIDKYIERGQITAIDCTVGNGSDILYLCGNMKGDSFVTGFDIQKPALENTESLLKENGYENYKLIFDGHQNIDLYFDEETADLIIYNLGYLPKYDKNITTQVDTTLISIKKSLHILRSKGLISIAAYPGHIEGSREKEALDEFLSTIDSKVYHVMKCEYINQSNTAPLIYYIERK